MLGPLRWNMPKITKSDAKLSKMYEVQGSIATCVNYGRISIDSFTTNLLQSVMVK